MAKILVTGGLGFVGSNLVPELGSRGHKVWVCDLMHSEKQNYVRCDVTKYDQLERLFNLHDFDFVYHLAAEYGRWNCEDYDENAIVTNIVGTRNMLKAQQKHGFKMVFFSSAEVYGDFGGVMTESVMDNIAIKQMNEYAIDKWHGELMCLSFAEMHGNEVVRIRPGCMYGIHEYYHPYRGVIPVFIYKTLMNEPYTCYLGHTRIHDYIVDSCKTYANIVDNFKAGEVYNVGGKPEWNHTIKELSDLILRTVGRSDEKIIYKPEEPFTTKHKTLDSSKAIRDLGHNPSTPLEEGIPKTVEWMKSIYGRKV
jgi:dTDP-glucose 4,6-dehydratase